METHTDIKVEDLMKLAPTKRDRILKKIRTERKMEERAKLPVLNREEIIRFRLPPHKAIIRAVQQEGFENSAEYIKQLIDYQEYVRNSFGPDTTVWVRPRLMNSLVIMEELRRGLIKAETAHKMNNFGMEITEILKLAVQYAFGEEDWWWLGHQLLEQGIAASLKYNKDGGEQEAIARYIFGKFLLEKVTDMEAATEHLTISRNLSVEKPWSARNIFKDKHQNSVFSEVSVLLYKVILKQARQCMKSDPQKAIKLCSEARKSALDGCDYSGETQAYVMKGQCEMNIHDTSAAIISFNKALSIQKHHEDPQWKCEAMCLLATAYLKHGILNTALEMLYSLKIYAKENKLMYYVAQSYKYLGEYYLREGTPANSTPLLKTALKIFNEGHYITEAESTRNYAAISIGIELMPSYLALIKSCMDTTQDISLSMKRLLDWKDSRTNFWTDSAQVSFVALDDADSEDDVDLMKLSTINTKPEFVLSVQSLGSRSYHALTASKGYKSGSKINIEKSKEEIDDENPDLIPLHVASDSSNDDEK